SASTTSSAAETCLSKVHYRTSNFKHSSTSVAQIPARPPRSTVRGVRCFHCHEPCGRPEMVKFLKLIKNDKGATAIEYGLIAALIAVAAIGAMQGIGNKLNSTFNNVSNSLN